MDLSRRLQSTALIFLVFILVIQSTHSRFHGKRHKRQNGARLYHPETNIIPLGEGTDPSEWGPWSSPSECSRSCGGGVAYQSRECLRYGINGAPICKGGNRKYFSCNTQDCPEEEPDFRAQQCSRFNNVPFDGVRYEWIPYTKAPNPCELNCMPRGERFYYRQKAKVIDGTRCNDQSLDVCVDGRCESVGCDMLLGSNQREDKCRKCAGDGKSCRTVSGVFDLANLQAGYNDILLVPAGATNINIRERSPSNNYFACRNASGHYYLNGNWKIEFPRPISFAGALWSYERHPQGFAAPDHLSCLGPINEAIFLVLLVQDRNVGVQYEYSVPENTVKATEQDTYSWTITAFGPCSVSCGGGFQTRNVTCNSRTSLEQVDNSLCDSTTQPADTQQCNQAECAPRWVEGPWEKCSKPCGPEGKQERKVHCERVSANGVAKEVKDAVCLEEAGNKPATIQECNVDSVCPKWHIGPWTPCNKLCGEGIQKRRAICYKEENKRKIILSDDECLEEKPESEQSCMLQPCEGVDWITSSWSGCAECGLAQETRTAICGSRSGKIYNETFCSTQKPELIRPCKSKPCQYIWFTSEWSACSAKCGKGVQTRIVLCGKFDGTAVTPAEDNSKCSIDEKPEISQECEAEIEKCPGQWFTGPWGECSKKCGGGERTREVICLVNGTKSDNCLEKDLEFTSEKCNPDPCTDDELIPVDGTAKPLEPDDEGEEECEDDDEEEEKDDDIYGVETFARQVELKASTAIDFDKATTAESSLLTDDLMMSDATGFELTDVTGSDTTDIPSTVEGSGDETTFEGSGASDISTIEGATDESGVTEDMISTIKFTSVESSGPTSESTDVTGESGATEEDVTGMTSESGPTVLSSESSTDVSGLSSDVTGMTSESGPTVLSSESPTDVSSESPKDLTTSSGETLSSSELSSAVTEDGLSSVSSEGSSDLTSVTPGLSTDLLSTEGSLSSVASSDLTDITGTDDQMTKTSDASPTTSDSSASTEPTDTTPTTDITPTSDTTESSSTESSSDTSGISSTESAISSTPLDLSSSSSSGLTDVTTESSDLTSTGSAVTTESGVTSSGSDITSTGSEVTAAGSDVTPTGSEVTTTGSDVTPTGGDSSATTPDSVTSDSTDTSSDASGVTDITSDSSDITTSSPMSEVTGTDLDVSRLEGSTEVTSSTETGASQPSTESPETGTSSSDITTASGVSDSEDATTVSGTDVTGATDEEQTKISDTTESVDLSSGDVTTVSGVEETTVDIWTTTISSEDAGDLTTPNTIQAAVTKEQKPRKCKPKTKKVDCSKAGFGCCPDGVSVAKGPFDEGCPMIETCEDSKYGCCPDGLSPAKGKDNKGCPASLCAESLFGCCPDKFTPAEGEDNEGCPEPTTQAPTTEGDCDPGTPGCCPDGVTGLEGCASTVSGTDETTETVSGETTESSIVEEPTTEGIAAPCSSTPHGCCPDGETPAQGENFLGCDTEHESDCFNSLYGCCQDNRTAATGPNKQGCEPCLLEPFGCCPDNNTPAHGPNYEGCCLDAPYGCCPDNINSAQGPDYEGCDCKYSSYGCCPDNETPARGPDMAGCGCQYSPHGCCPDKITPAEGENFAGCPCHTFQFGCCPDGVTVPQGPHNYGCHCSQTEHKCCPDDTTAAKGPNFEGCTCAESKFGCCPDGVTEAKGKKFEGCVNVPEPIQKSCSLNKDSGPCTNYTINYFFDTAYGACVRFWYGGCEGNNNRFQTPEECNRTCEDYKGKEACLLPRSSGPCPGYHKKYYFDTDRNQCTEFNYGGCFGNTNRFDTLAECQRTCAVDESLLPCEQPVDAGPCQGNFERWYYDNVTDVCRPFTYGGCKGNKNNYATEHACNYHCKQPGVHRDGGSPQETPPETIKTDTPDICETYNNECRDLRCPYGIRRFYSADGCQRCECEDPCSGYNCPDGFSCAVDIADGGVDFTPTCRQKNKPGACPSLPQTSRCDRECYTDADCRGESKCCHDGCGYLCVPPAEVHAVTTTTYRPPPLVYPGNRPPFLEEKPQHELDVDTPSGGVATLRCFATGYPTPTISWRKGSVILNTNQGRYVINAKGDLTIVQVHRTDSGSYICIADNGLGAPVTREIKLVVTAAVPREAYIIGERNSTVVAHLGSPAALRCPSGGHPKPTVYWWRGKSRLPLKSNHFEVNRDYSLVFSGVRLTDLGVYTCEAWSGRGRPASIDITLKAYGPAHATNRDEEQYLPYIVDPPTAAPTTTLTTQSPYHPPTARRPPPVYPTVHTPPQRQEPVKVQLRQDEGNTFAVGSDVVLYCDVEGYPTPVVTWTKDDEPIQPSARKQIVENPHRLVIYGVTQADTGYYGCTGRNSHSYNTHKELFTINGIYIHPECLDNQFFADCSLIVKGRYCNTNAFYKKFCCRSCTLDGQLPSTHPNSLPFQT